MTQIKKVRELMIPVAEYPVIHDDNTLKDAVKMLKAVMSGDKHHRSLLVFSRHKRVGGEEQLVAILTVRDILNSIRKNAVIYDQEQTSIAHAFHIGYRGDYQPQNIFEKTAAVRVADSVRPLVKAFLQADDDVTKAVEMMLKENIILIPVFEGKKVTGIIRAIDIIDYIGDLL